MITYQHKHFVNCRFNPFEKDFLKKYEILNEFSNDEKLMRYIAAMYDPNSPLIRDISHLDMRKRVAAEIAGYDLVKDEEMLDDIMKLTSEDVFIVVDRFLKEVVRSRLWYQICAREQTVFEYAGRMLRPIKFGTNEKQEINAVAVKSALSKDMNDIEKILEEDYRKLYGNDDDLKNVAMAKRFTPEDRAANV